MKKVADNLYECYNTELKNHNASTFDKDTTVYIRSTKTDDFLFIINLRRGQYKSFGLKSYVEDAKTMKALCCVAGTKKPFTPYYIKDFIDR